MLKRVSLGLAIASLWVGATQAAPSFELARIGSRVSTGEPVAYARAGLGCVVHRTFSWDADLQRELIGTEDTAKAEFRQAAETAGIQVVGSSSDLFATGGDHADYRVGALIIAVRRDFCAKADGILKAMSGKQTQQIEWQIYSTVEGRVVATAQTETSVSAGSRLSLDDLHAKLRKAALADSLRQLFASSSFQRVSTKSSDAPPSTPTAAAAMLPVALAAAIQPVALKDAAKAVVTIFAGDWLGSGVLVSADGYVLTNYHVAGGSGGVRIRWPDGHESVGQVIRGDARRDVALVKTAPPGAAPVPVRAARPELGETVYAIGTPREREFAGTLTRGIISQPQRTLEGQHYIQSDVAITHGNSGGPLLDEKGWIIGLAQSVYEPDGVGQNINFFVPIDEALAALAIKPAS